MGALRNTCLGASTKLDEREWKARDLADLYFDRWPNQEANFRAVNQATKSKQVHGYGKRLVDNISVVTELDKLDGQLRGGVERLERQQAQEDELARTLRQDERELARKSRRHGTVQRSLEGRAVVGKKVLLSTQRLVEEHLELSSAISAQREAVSRQRAKLEAAGGRVQRTSKKLQSWQERQQLLQTRRRIFAHDVELDSLFSLLKVGLTLLVTFVLKEYLGDARMDVVTFLDRLATLPASVRVTPQLEIVTFEYNRRDPEVMGLLEANCQAINASGLRLRNGRTLRIAVEKAPKRSRPPPPGSRVGSGDRFRR